MKPGDKVKIGSGKNDRLVGREATVLAVRDSYPKHIKVHVPGVPRQPGTSEVWFITQDEIEDGVT